MAFYLKLSVKFVTTSLPLFFYVITVNSPQHCKTKQRFTQTCSCVWSMSPSIFLRVSNTD